MSKFQSPLLNFAEAVLAKESGVQDGKFSSWDLGIWLGRPTRTKTFCRRPNWRDQGQDGKRHPETLKWDRESHDLMCFVLVDWSQNLRLVGNQHLGAKRAMKKDRE